eukprot:CAMPEP_0174845336 /NCGR_PEP_ID=MMETSP1114-20130205/11668_1 /TAXON_ID=312471 /ORGANISM="Neobodo designis, Strain CCAP 1951/1" /LENGTH=198 /DNA_ID=CAMNT_0016079583 /DNA_START=277 /DNA_END=873 /DNA_ORIENTATION=-
MSHATASVSTLRRRRRRGAKQRSQHRAGLAEEAARDDGLPTVRGLRRAFAFSLEHRVHAVPGAAADVARGGAHAALLLRPPVELEQVAAAHADAALARLGVLGVPGAAAQRDGQQGAARAELRGLLALAEVVDNALLLIDAALVVARLPAALDAVLLAHGRLPHVRHEVVLHAAAREDVAVGHGGVHRVPLVGRRPIQ